MPSAAQVAANRANSQKSTGPRTPEGKAASRFNALSHGMDAASIVIPGEDPAEYERIANSYHRDFHPQSSIQEFHVATLIRADWQKRRLQRTEAKLYRALLAEGPTPEDLDVAVLRDSPTAKLLRRVFSQIASLERAFFRALNDLRRIQRDSPKSEEEDFEAAALPPEFREPSQLAGLRAGFPPPSAPSTPATDDPGKLPGTGV